MRQLNILFNPGGIPKPPDVIQKKISHFGDGYINATHTIIWTSQELDKEGKIFSECASLILSSFGMTRSGPFKGKENKLSVLTNCWEEVGENILEIKSAITNSGYTRERYLLELGSTERNNLASEIFVIFKQLLPFTMGKYAYGLVAASKILFSVLPEIVLPIDNSQWLNVFKTVDIGDVINLMADDIQKWERATGESLTNMDSSNRLTTLPAVYNVMAMAARPD